MLKAAAECEQTLKKEYDEAIEETPNREVRAVLRRQREEVEFGEQVFRNIKSPSVDEQDG